MKKKFAVTVVCALALSLAGCGKQEPESGRETAAASENMGSQETAGPGESVSDAAEGKEADGVERQEPESGMTEQDAADGSAGDGADGGNTLVVYFSWSGNTEHVANAIADRTGADVFEIVPQEAYVDDYNALLDIATEEKKSGARPVIAGSVEDMARYDTVFVGYPNWWSDMPMILYTFFDSYDLSGKTVAPFCTSGGSGLSDTVNSIRKLEPEADVLEGLHIGSSAAADPDAAVGEWLESLAPFLNTEETVAAQNAESGTDHMEDNTMKITAGDTTFTASLADNSSAEALKELLAQGPLTINMSDYAGMEKVGPIGTDLPRNDEQISTGAGDIILYQGNSLVIYYGTNSWNFTRIGRIEGVTGEALLDAFGEGDVTVTFSLE